MDYLKKLYNVGMSQRIFHSRLEEFTELAHAITRVLAACSVNGASIQLLKRDMEMTQKQTPTELHLSADMQGFSQDLTNLVPPFLEEVEKNAQKIHKTERDKYLDDVTARLRTVFPTCEMDKDVIARNIQTVGGENNEIEIIVNTASVLENIRNAEIKIWLGLARIKKAPRMLTGVLDTARARQAFEILTAKGIITPAVDGSHYIWRGRTKALLAHVTDIIWNSPRTGFPLSEVIELFQDTGLKNARKKLGQARGHDYYDNLLKDIPSFDIF